jgi:hypothetical protein
LLPAFALVLSLSATGFGRTFRGGINGTVTDQSGAVVSGAPVIAVEISTNVFYKTASRCRIWLLSLSLIYLFTSNMLSN